MIDNDSINNFGQINLNGINQDALFLVRTANECIEDAKNHPIPKMLFSEFWHEGELCILFADTNLGKSILSVQIANAISKGIPIPGFKLGAEKQVVLYFDFEMSDKQFQNRYSENYCNDYQFDDNFLRININPNCTEFSDFDTQLITHLERTIEMHEAKILIVDNLTYLKSQATDTAREALPLMKMLKNLKIKYNLSILALAHTPKRNMYNIITINDLAGSKQLANFADSVFAIGLSNEDKSLRYIKQLKARATEIVHNTDNIVVCSVVKTINFLEFEFQDFGKEIEHLKIPDESTQNELDESIITLKKNEPGISNYAIAQRLDTNRVRVARVIKRNGFETENSNN